MEKISNNVIPPVEYQSILNRNKELEADIAGLQGALDEKTRHWEEAVNRSMEIEAYKEAGMEIIFSSKSYKPFRKYIIGALQEKESRKDKEVKWATWAYYGFEAIIWAKKI